MGDTTVVGTTKGSTNERFRRCKSCGYTFHTIEAVKFDDYWKQYAKEAYELNYEVFVKKGKNER
jgi:transcriptional repressor NrdR